MSVAASRSIASTFGNWRPELGGDAVELVGHGGGVGPGEHPSTAATSLKGGGTRGDSRIRVAILHFLPPNAVEELPRAKEVS